jgi:hypothetical protein
MADVNKPWSAQEKIDYVKGCLADSQLLTGNNDIDYELFSVGDGFEEFFVESLSKEEQRKILRKLANEGFLEFLNEEKGTIRVRLLPQETEAKARRSNVYWLNGIRTVNDLLRDHQLVGKFRSLFSHGEGITRGHKYKWPTDEKNDDFIALLIDLDLVEFDWNELNKQTHRAVGYRIIEFWFTGDKILDIFDRLNGKGSLIDKRTIEFISRNLGERFSAVQIIGLLKDWGVPDSLIEYPNTKWRMVNSILLYYATSLETTDLKTLVRVIEETCHPLTFDGNESAARALSEDIHRRLQYEGRKIEKGVLYRKDENEAWVAAWGCERQEKTDPIQQTTSQKLQSMLTVMTPKNIHILAGFSISGMGAILDAAYTGNFHSQSLDLNRAYIALHFYMETIVNRNDTEVYRADFGLLPENVLEYNDATEFEQEGTYAPAIARLLAKSQKQLFIHSDEHEISAETQGLINEWKEKIEVLVVNHKKEKSVAWERMLARAEKNAKSEPSTVGKSDEITRATSSAQPQPLRIEIVNPVLSMQLMEDGAQVKKGKKRLTLPSFPRTEWSAVLIRFLDEQNILISDGKTHKPVDYRSLGFENTKKKTPSTAWMFLLNAAKNGGKTAKIDSPIPDAIKQVKAEVTDVLRNMFKNDTDPFEPFSEHQAYVAKFRLEPGPGDSESQNSDIQEYLRETAPYLPDRE